MTTFAPPSSLVRDRIDAATDGLVARFGAELLNSCPHSPTRLGVLGCSGCSWSGVGGEEDTCALEELVGFYQDKVLSSWVFTALVIAGLLALLALPGPRRRGGQDPAAKQGGRVWRRAKAWSARQVRSSIRFASFAERMELAGLWLALFVGNFFFAFLLTYFIVCEASGAAQVHDATVITLQVMLLAYTLWRYHCATGKLKDARVLFHESHSVHLRRLGVALSVVLPLIVVAAWMLSRRFSEAPKIVQFLARRFDEEHYSMCFAGAPSYRAAARPTTVIQYLKALLQLISAEVFLLAGFRGVWVFVRGVVLAAVYVLFALQLSYGETLVMTSGPAQILTGTIANDFLELAIAHAFGVIGIVEVVETHLSGTGGLRSAHDATEEGDKHDIEDKLDESELEVQSSVRPVEDWGEVEPEIRKGKEDREVHVQP